MAGTKVNKAAKIRETFERLGLDARPKDVIAQLAAAKIKVSSAQVSNIKGTLSRPAKNGHAKRAKPGAIALSDLLAAKKLVESLGSIDRAQVALAAWSQLQ